ncbi:hypothetical protein LguiA_003869 [Lonicera macranthoides]
MKNIVILCFKSNNFFKKIKLIKNFIIKLKESQTSKEGLKQHYLSSPAKAKDLERPCECY